MTNPHKARIAQDELNTVVGRKRIPEWDDTPRLPYITAFVNEVLRWQPLVISGLLHCNLENTYNGSRIPKGSVVVGSHYLDKKVFGDPQVFLPVRWLENQSLPVVAFGFGRRVCPGQHIARQGLTFAIARIFWAFDVKKAPNEQDHEVEVDSSAFTDFFVVAPLPLEARLVLRDKRVREIIDRKWTGMEKDLDEVMDEIRARQRNMRDVKTIDRADKS